MNSVKRINLVFFVTSILLLHKLANAGDSFPRACEGTVKHIHLAVGHDPSREMTVSFASQWNNPGNEAPIGGVRLGSRPDKLDRFVAEHEYPLQYKAIVEHSSHPDELYYSPYQHHITIDGLQPNTTYYYITVVGDRQEGIESLEGVIPVNSFMNQEDVKSYMRRRLAPPPYDGLSKPCTNSHTIRSFTTAPEGSQSPVSFAITGDLGQFQHSQETLEHMRRNRNNIDAVILVGDIAYTTGDHRRWDTFFDFLDDYSIFDEVPLQIATGNHDIEKGEKDAEIFQAYETRFRMPQVRPAERQQYGFPGLINKDAPPYPLPYDWGNAYYSFTYGPAKHVVVSAYSNMDPGSQQYNWLIKEFASVNRTVTPWLLVSIHTPLYSTFSAHTHDLQIIAAQEYLEPLLVNYNVNVVFTGHIHAYQRTKTVANGKVERKGPMHITVGAGGRQCDAPFKSEIQEPWIKKRDSSMFGYGNFCIFNRTHAEWTWIPLSLSEKHNHNTVKDHDEIQLRQLKHDHIVMENQYFL